MWRCVSSFIACGARLSKDIRFILVSLVGRKAAVERICHVVQQRRDQFQTNRRARFFGRLSPIKVPQGSAASARVVILAKLKQSAAWHVSRKPCESVKRSFTFSH